MKRAKIVATIGPASQSPDVMRSLLLAGVNVARINMSHGTHEGHGKNIAALRGLATELNLPVAILIDLCGPKIRTGKLAGGGPVHLKAGNHLTLTPVEIEGTEERVTCSYEGLAYDAKPGDRILLDDGLIELHVTEIVGSDVVCLVINGGPLSERKGINLPSIPTSLPSMTEKDREDLAFGIGQSADYVALSFVRRPEDCRQAKALIEELGATTPLIAKIEKPEALGHLDEILDIVDGVMVARGDLGVEAETERVPIFQKEIIRHANRKGKLVITATQMLQSMVENPRPTRAEASDVANAVLDGSDAVMLSAETAAGQYPIEAVRTMTRIIEYTEDVITYQRSGSTSQRVFGRASGSHLRALAEAAVFAADELGSKLIVVYTEGGKTAYNISNLRPTEQIIALTHRPETFRRLSAVWGIQPVLLSGVADEVEKLFQQGDEILLERGLVQKGERVVIVSGSFTGLPLPNLMCLHTIGEFNQG